MRRMSMRQAISGAMGVMKTLTSIRPEKLRPFGCLENSNSLGVWKTQTLSGWKTQTLWVSRKLSRLARCTQVRFAGARLRSLERAKKLRLFCREPYRIPDQCNVLTDF